MEIIFVCTGNTCRSPIAQGYLKSFNIKGLTVKSRGIFADGSKASENSVIVAKELGFDISSHISTPLTKEDLSADMFICMSYSHLEALKSLGIKDERLSVLGGGISDPFGGGISLYRSCAMQIASCIDELVFGGVFTGIKISPVTKDHLSHIERLEKESFSTPWSKEALLESLNSGYRFFVAEKEKKVLGYIGVNCVLDEGYISNVAVYKDFQNMGVGNLLIKRLISLSRELALSFLTLEVRATNQSAIHLYSKNGFSEEGRRKNFYTHPTEDAIIMTRRFNFNL